MQFVRRLASALLVVLLASSPNARLPAIHAAAIIDSPSAGVSDPAIAAGIGSFGAYLTGNAPLLGQLHLDLSMPETSALIRIAAKSPSLQSPGFQTLSLGEQAGRIRRSVAAGAAQLLKSNQGITVRNAKNIPTTKLNETSQRLGDYAALAKIIPSLDAKELAARQAAVRKILSLRSDAPSLKKPAFDSNASGAAEPAPPKPEGDASVVEAGDPAVPPRQPLVTLRRPSPPAGDTENITLDVHSPTRGGDEHVAWMGKGDYSTLAFPTDGVDGQKLLIQALQDADSADQAAYNFDLIDWANALIAAAKAGKKVRIVGDHSNWFPNLNPQTNHGGRTSPRTQAMDLIVSALKNPAVIGKDRNNPNLQLFIVKGLDKFGINHLKITQFKKTGHDPLGQGGSANYTATSITASNALGHWENFGFTTDKARNALDQRMIDWVIRRAHPFKEGMTADQASPAFDPKDPIPADPKPSLESNGVKFPIASYAPNAQDGPGEEWLVKLINVTRQKLYILMFSPFYTPKMSAAMTQKLREGKTILSLVDEQQLRNAAEILLPLVQAGMQLRSISGPGKTLYPDKPYNAFQQKMHEKVMVSDPHLPDGIAKMLDSLNTSLNAIYHNFEAMKFWTGSVVARIGLHFEHLWSLGTPVTAQDLKRIIAKKKVSEEDPAGPWKGSPGDGTANPADPAPAPQKPAKSGTGRGSQHQGRTPARKPAKTGKRS